MGRIARGVVVAIILVLLLGNLTTNVVARSVHSTSDIDIFPQGAIVSEDSWYLDDRITFTQESAD